MRQSSESSESSGPLRAESLAGLCAIGGVVTGVASIVVALFAFFDGPNYSGAESGAAGRRGGVWLIG